MKILLKIFGWALALAVLIMFTVFDYLDEIVKLITGESLINL